MNILNINKNYQPNWKQNSIPNSINFRHKSYVTKTIMLQSENLEKVNNIKDLYFGVLDIFYHLSGKRQGLFRKSNTNILKESKVGFIFRDLTNTTSKLLHVAEFWNKDNKHFSFRILDKDKNLILRYIFRPDGEVEIAADKKDVKKSKVDIFQGSEKVLGIDILNNIISEFQKLKLNIDLLYENRCKPTHSFIESEMPQIKPIDFIYSEQINGLLKNYKDLLELFDKQHKYEHTIIKKEFWGKNYINTSSSGMIIPKEGSETELYYFCPFKHKQDDRLFKISLMDKEQNVIDTLVFFQDGKVMSMKNKTAKAENIKKENFLLVYKEDAIKFDLDNIFRQINSKINDFKKFIQDRDKTKQVKKETKKAQQKEQRETEKALKAKQKEQRKAEKASLLSEKETIKDNKIQHKDNVEQNIHTITTKNGLYSKNVKDVSPSAIVVPDEQLTKSQENGVSSIYRTIANSDNWNKNFYHFNLVELVNHFDTLFRMPAENHSHHLIHEKLNNGKILNNRLSMVADDGTKVVVTRVLLHDISKKINPIPDYAYKIELMYGNKKIIMQLKASTAQILKTKEDGSLLRGTLLGVSSISKSDFISKNPNADLIPKYMKEFFNYVDGEGINVVNTKQKIKQRHVVSEIDKFIEELRDRTEY